MTPTEAVGITRLVKAVCPSQMFDEFTADVWGDILEDVRAEDAKRAVRNLAGRQRYIAPNEIVDEVRRIRHDRLDRALPAAPPAELADDPAAQIEWLRDWRRRVADGEQPAAIEPSKPMPSLEGVFRTIPKD